MSLRLPRWESLSRDEQVPIINVPLTKDLWATGGPGTGKTVLALYRASQALAALRRTGNHASVVFMIYNKSLRKYLDEALAETQIADASATTWHSWLYQTYARITHNHVPELRKYHPDWSLVGPRLRSHFEQTGPAIDHLFLDETQDLPKPLLEVLRKAARVISTFSDPNQRIYEASADPSAIGTTLRVATNRYRLTRNYRNTRQIAEVAGLYRDQSLGEPPSAPTRQGNKPEAIEAEDLAQALGFVANYSDNQPELHIGLLVPDYESRNAIAGTMEPLLRKAEMQVYANKNEAFTFERAGIKLMTYDTAKGLEFDTVFLPLVGAEHGLAAPTDIERNRLYVACTRARNELYFLHTPATQSWAVETLIANADLVDWFTLRDTPADANETDLAF